MSKILVCAFLFAAFYSFAVKKDTATATFYMSYAVLFAVIDARDTIVKKVSK